MDIIELIEESWGWTGLAPERIVAENDFGNILVEDCNGTFWRICPEELECLQIAKDGFEFGALLKDEDFVDDWEMDNLIGLAEEALGILPEGQKFHLKVAGVLGGEYELDNICIISYEEQIRTTGALAKQIEDEE